MEGVAAHLHCWLSSATCAQWASQGRGVSSLRVCAVPEVLWLRLQILLLNKSPHAQSQALGEAAVSKWSGSGFVSAPQLELAPKACLEWFQ